MNRAKLKLTPKPPNLPVVSIGRIFLLSAPCKFAIPLSVFFEKKVNRENQFHIHKMLSLTNQKARAFLTMFQDIQVQDLHLELLSPREYQTIDAQRPGCLV